MRIIILLLSFITCAIQVIAQNSIFTLESENVITKNNVLNSSLDSSLTSYRILKIDLSERIFNKLKNSSKDNINLKIDKKNIYFHSNNLISQSILSRNNKAPLTYESDSFESLTINQNFLNGVINIKGRKFFIQPVSDFNRNSDKNLFVLFEESAVIPKKGSCAVSEEVKERKAHYYQKMNSSGCETIKLAIANDFSMFTKYTSATGVMNHNTAVINNIRPLFRSTFNDNIEYEIMSFFIPSTQGQDPFTTSTNYATILSSFKSWAQNANNEWGSLDYDLGEFWSSRNFLDNVIGYADTPYPSNSYDREFHVLEDYSNNATDLRNLAAHEIGHNLSAQHDSGGAPYIMAPSINSSSSWSSSTITNINTRISTIGGSLTNCSCGEVITGPNVICSGENAEIQITITDGVGPYDVVYSNGTTNFTLSNYVSGTTFSVNPITRTTYEILSINDLGTNGFSYTCGSSMTHTVSVYNIAGTAEIDGNSTTKVVESCDVSQSLALSSDISSLGADQVIGWWITEDNPISYSLTNGNLTNSLGAATIGGSLSNPVNHIFESTSGSPQKNYSLNFDCSTLDQNKSYYATPFISNQKVAIAPTHCIRPSSVAYSTTVNGAYAGKIVFFDAVDICVPIVRNNPIFTYTVQITNYTGDPDNLNIYFQNEFGQQNYDVVPGSGTYYYTQSDFNNISDPGLQDIAIFAFEWGRNGMQNATLSVSLDITYPGEPAIIFPDISDVNSCTIGTPIQISCNCTTDPCTDVGDIALKNLNLSVNDTIRSSGMLTLDTVMVLNPASVFWQSQQSILLNPEFSVELGSELILSVDDCAIPN